MKRGMYARPKTAAGYRVSTRVDGKQSRRCSQDWRHLDVSLHVMTGHLARDMLFKQVQIYFEYKG